MADEDDDRAARRERARRRAREADGPRKARDEKAKDVRPDSASAPPSGQDVDEASSIEGGGVPEGGEKRKKWSLDDVVGALRTRTKVLQDGSVYVNEKLLRALTKVGARALPAVLALLDDSRWTTRWAALAAVQRIALRDETIDAAEVLPRVAQALQDPKGRVRARAVEAVAAFRRAKDEVLEALIKVLGDQNAEVSRLAVMHVLELGLDPKDLTERMVQVLTRRRNVYVRVGALLVLLHLGKSAKAAVPHLVEAIEDPAPEVREYANLALTAIRTPSMRLQVIRTASMRLKAVEDSSDEGSAKDAGGSDESDAADADDEKRPGPRAPKLRRRRRRLR